METGDLLWLAGGWLLFLSSFAVTTALNLLPAVLAPVGIVVGLAIEVGLWLWTFKVLTNNDIGWRPLLPGAVLGAVGPRLPLVPARYSTQTVTS